MLSKRRSAILLPAETAHGKDVGKTRTSQRIAQKELQPNLLDLINNNKQLPPKVEVVQSPPKVVAKKRTYKRKPKVDVVPSPPKVDVVPSPPKVDVVPSPPKVDVVPSPPKSVAKKRKYTRKNSVAAVNTPSPPKVDVLPSPPKEEVVPSPPKVDIVPSPLKEVDQLAVAKSSASKSDTQSIITIVIYCHGMDMVEAPFTDINVRILSVSGNTGAIAFGDSDEIDRIKTIYHETTTDYQKLIAEKGIKQKTLEALHPTATTCKRMPKLAFNRDENDFNLQSTYQYLKANFSNSTKKDKYATAAKGVAQKRQYDEFTKQAVLADIETGDVHKIYTPVINRLYGCNSIAKQAEIKKDIKQRKDAKMGRAGHRTSLEEGFGIYVLDTCNYNGPVKIDDELTSKKGYNKPFIDFLTSKQTVRTISEQYTLNDGDFDLKTLVQHLHTLGFDIINIIDLGCRACSIQDASIRSEIIAKENVQSAMINTQI
jgi:hypothetical protein